MGYTHFFLVEKAFTEEQWNIFRTRIAKILPKYKDILANGLGKKNTKPIISQNVIMFNGIEDDSHETFCISKDNSNSNSCKTSCKPYDKVVVEVLKIARECNPNIILISDGGPNIFD